MWLIGKVRPTINFQLERRFAFVKQYIVPSLSYFRIALAVSNLTRPQLNFLGTWLFRFLQFNQMIRS